MSDELKQYELPDGQLSLLPEETTDKMLVEREYSQGIYSGVQLKQSEPDRYMAICALLADGSISQRQISRLSGVSRNLVSAINRQASDIEPLKQQMASRARNLGQLCLERAEEIVADRDAKISLRDLAILAGVSIDKSQLLSGEATQRVEKVASEPGHDDFAEEMRLMRQSRGIEVSPSPVTGCSEGNSSPKGIEGGSTDGPGDDEAAGCVVAGGGSEPPASPPASAAAEQPGGDEND